MGAGSAGWSGRSRQAELPTVKPEESRREASYPRAPTERTIPRRWQWPMTAADRWTWIDIVRRARLGRTTKSIAYLVATYADGDGSRVFPGVATVAVAAEVDYKTAKKALAELVAKGLLERVGTHTVRGGATEYRLVLADDLQENVEVLTPAAFEVEVERRRKANRRRTGNGTPRTDPDVQGTRAPVPDEPEEPATGNGVPAEEAPTGNGVPSYGEPRSAVHNHDLNTTTTYPLAADLRTDLEVVGDSPPDQEPDLADEEKPRLRLVHPVNERRGLGFCWPCYDEGKTTLAADPMAGAECEFHLRQEAS